MSKSPEKYNSRRPNIRGLLALTGSAAAILPAAATASPAVHPKPVSQKQNQAAGRDVSRMDRRIAAVPSALRGVASTDGSTGDKLSDLTYIVDAPGKQYIFKEIVPITPEGQTVNQKTQFLSIQETTVDTQVNVLFERNPHTHRWAVGEVATSATGSTHHSGLNQLVLKANHIIDEAAAVHVPVQTPPPSQ